MRLFFERQKDGVYSVALSTLQPADLLSYRSWEWRAGNYSLPVIFRPLFSGFSVGNYLILASGYGFAHPVHSACVLGVLSSFD